MEGSWHRTGDFNDGHNHRVARHLLRILEQLPSGREDSGLSARQVDGGRGRWKADLRRKKSRQLPAYFDCFGRAGVAGRAVSG